MSGKKEIFIATTVGNSERSNKNMFQVILTEHTGSVQTTITPQ
jgi:hypothetical protein